jgi:hypothetical protein
MIALEFLLLSSLTMPMSWTEIFAHEELGRSGGAKWRWRWAGLKPLHFTECPLYSPLTIGTRIQPKEEGRNGNGQEIVSLKPTFHGIGIDLKELGRRVWTWCRNWWDRPS